MTYNRNRMTIVTDTSYILNELPHNACRYDYPEGYWARFMTFSVSDEDRDFIREMRSDPDIKSAMFFDEQHEKNIYDMTRIRNEWMRYLAISSKVYYERLI